MNTEYDPNCDCSECARAERDHLRAQMQPLPAGRILGMMPDTGDPRKVIAFARRIERAHGITGDVIDDVLTAGDDTPGVVWKATSLTGDTAHFGERSAAKAWARSGTVEPVPLKHLRLVPLGTDCGPDCRQCGMTCRRARQIDEQFAPKLAIELECMLIDHPRNRAAAEKTLSAYRAAWDAINPGPATSMGEPL